MVNLKSSTHFLEAAASLLAPTGLQGVLVRRLADGTVSAAPVQPHECVLDVTRDLFEHLSAEPVSEAFLEQLRDYAAARLAARAEARATGGIVVPGIGQRWEIVHRQAFEHPEVA